MIRCKTRHVEMAVSTRCLCGFNTLTFLFRRVVSYGMKCDKKRWDNLLDAPSLRMYLLESVFLLLLIEDVAVVCHVGFLIELRGEVRENAAGALSQLLLFLLLVVGTLVGMLVKNLESIDCGVALDA